MTCVGVDLAWGRRAPTGLCAVDAGGRVTASATVTDDRDILAWCGRHAPRPAVVGFDAPLVLTNAAGRRQCEQLLSRAFGAQKAGAHSSNLSMPVFSDGGRAMALALALGLEVEPPLRTGYPVGLAVEVYPHAALVACLELAERLPYKAGRGRSAESRRAAMGELVLGLESLAGRSPEFDVRANPRWAELVERVGEARRHFQLEAVEDELDAHVCAYVAHALSLDLSDGGARVRVLGEWRSGAMVTPVDERQARVLDALEEARNEARNDAPPAGPSHQGESVTPPRPAPR